MDARTALDRLSIGVAELDTQAQAWQRREDYFRGRQDRPYAPEGVNEEYEALQDQAIANWLELGLAAPIQRLQVDGFRTGRDHAADTRAWASVWQPNNLDARQHHVYVGMMVHDQGVVSVWPGRGAAPPLIRPESSKRVHLEMDPEDPFRVLWAVKRFTLRVKQATSLWTPRTQESSREVGVVYDESTWHRFERSNGSGAWEAVKSGNNPMGEPPFVPFSPHADEDGNRYPAIEPLMPQQDAINTIRFNTLLAMQFSAFRQRVFTGYDPVVRDDQGKPVWRKNDDGSLLLDANGQPVPVVSSPGRIGVDRALVFPGAETRVFDLDESNLENYITVLGEFLTQFFATAQVPPQYLLSRMANLSGDALAGAESTLAALVRDLQTCAGEAWEHVMRLANRAWGEDAEDFASSVIWGEGEARSFAQTVDAITKLISIGFPRRPAFEMIPGATTTKVDDWMRQVAAEDTAAVTAGLEAIAGAGSLNGNAAGNR